jgi:hypothetical protein
MLNEPSDRCLSSIVPQKGNNRERLGQPSGQPLLIVFLYMPTIAPHIYNPIILFGLLYPQIYQSLIIYMILAALESWSCYGGVSVGSWRGSVAPWSISSPLLVGCWGLVILMRPFVAGCCKPLGYVSFWVCVAIVSVVSPLLLCDWYAFYDVLSKNNNYIY